MSAVARQRKCDVAAATQRGDVAAMLRHMAGGWREQAVEYAASLALPTYAQVASFLW